MFQLCGTRTARHGLRSALPCNNGYIRPLDVSLLGNCNTTPVTNNHKNIDPLMGTLNTKKQGDELEYTPRTILRSKHDTSVGRCLRLTCLCLQTTPTTTRPVGLSLNLTTNLGMLDAPCSGPLLMSQAHLVSCNLHNLLVTCPYVS